MAVLWFVLKIIFWILIGLLAVVLTLLILPVTAEMSYSQEKGFSLVARVLCFWYTVLPQKEKTVKADEQSREDGKATANKNREPSVPEKSSTALESVQADKTDAIMPKLPVPAAKGGQQAAVKQSTDPSFSEQKKTKQEPVWNKLSGLLNKAKELALIAGKAIRLLFKGVWIHSIRIYLPVHAADAAQTAIQTGQIHGAAGAALGVLNHTFHLSFKQYEIEPDYIGDRQNKAFFSCKITSCLLIMIVVVIWALPKVMKTLKK